MHNLSDYQRRKLLKNPKVEKITEKHVVFTSKFKIKSVEKFLDGHSATDIFVNANINLDFFKPNYAQYCLKKWKKKYLDEGKEAFLIEKRGSGSSGRPKKENLDELTYQELQAIVEVQRGVIEELKKKRALAKKK
jgi:transposase